MTTERRFLVDAPVMRQAIADSIQETEGTPAAQFLYIPARHTQALSPRTPLVVGIRGAGKSVCWEALQDEAKRQIVSKISPDWLPEKGVEVSAGFGPAQRPLDFPDRPSIAQILNDGYESYTLWRAVVLDHVFRGVDRDGPLRSLTTWKAKTAWVWDHPEEVANALFERDNVLFRDGKTHLILFDALDRLADDWPRTQKLVQGLLQLMLDLRGYRAIRAKVFLRPDMVEDRSITAFPDASKILADRVDLEWSVLDLYSLLWRRLGNAPNGAEEFRELTFTKGSGAWHEYAETWMVPKRLQQKESLQRRVLSALASDYMGKSKKRGVTYTWLPKHLADAANQVSPRSFLAALRHAAEKTPAELTDGSSIALHYTSIQHGVQEASRIRVREIGEDYPWVELVVKELKDLLVPCPIEDITQLWTDSDVLRRLEFSPEADVKLPPRRLAEGPRGVIEDLKEIGVFSSMRDGRINMPDVYRVAFGLGRKGGVKPLRR